MGPVSSNTLKTAFGDCRSMTPIPVTQKTNQQNVHETTINA